MIANQDAASVRSAYIVTPTPTVTQTMTSPTQGGVTPTWYIDFSAPSSYSGTGSTIYDITSGGNNVTLNGGEYFYQSPKYVAFDGTSSDYITSGFGDSEYNLDNKEYTFTFWLKIPTSIPSGSQGGYGIVSNYNFVSQTFLIEYGYAGNSDAGKIIFYERNSSGNDNYIQSPTAYNDDTWHHWAAVAESDNLKLYVDGVYLGSSNGRPGGDITTGQDWQIMWRKKYSGSSQSAHYTKGDLASMKFFYEKALTSEQVNADYNSGLTRVNTPTVTQTATVTRTPSQGFYPADSNVWYDNKYLASEITPLVHLDESSYSSGTLTDLEGNINYTNSGVTTLSGGLYFDGSSYAYASNSLPLSGSYTINVNITPTTNNSNEAIYSLTPSADSNHGLYFAQEVSSAYYTHRMPIGSSGGNISAGNVFTANQNVTVTIAWNGDTGEQYIYKNGTQVQYSDTSKDNFPSSVNYHAIGALSYSGNRLLNGIIYDFKLFDQYLSAEQIVSINNFHRSNDLVFGTDQYYPNVSLLMHMDGADGSTTFTDSSSANNTTSTVSGSTQISTSQYKYGGSSSSFATDGRIQYNSGGIGAFGTGDFTVEYWWYPNDFDTTQTTLATTRGSNGWNIGYNSASALNWYGGGAHRAQVTRSLTAQQWYHIAYVRSSGTLSLYVDGVFESSSSDTTNYSYNDFSIGARPSTDSAAEYFDGYLDEIRITKGFARYTSDFDVPAGPFPNSNGTAPTY
jgi:hypothetical protein